MASSSRRRPDRCCRESGSFAPLAGCGFDLDGETVVVSGPEPQTREGGNT